VPKKLWGGGSKKVSEGAWGGHQGKHRKEGLNQNDSGLTEHETGKKKGAARVCVHHTEEISIQRQVAVLRCRENINTGECCLASDEDGGEFKGRGAGPICKWGKNKRGFRHSLTTG